MAAEPGSILSIAPISEVDDVIFSYELGHLVQSIGGETIEGGVLGPIIVNEFNLDLSPRPTIAIKDGTSGGYTAGNEKSDVCFASRQHRKNPLSCKRPN